MLCFGASVPLRPAVRVALCMGAEVLEEDAPSRLVTRVRAFEPHVILFDYAHADTEARALAYAVARAAPEATLVLLCEPSPPPDMEKLLGQPWFRHMLGREAPWFMPALTSCLARIFGQRLFGIEAFLPWGSRVIRSQVTGSTDKQLVFDRIEAFMASLGLRGRLVPRILDLADELLMNAIYDAPRDRETGEARYATLSREEAITLDPQDQPTFSFGSDGRTLVIAVSDPFGGLDPETLKRYVAKGLRRGDDQIDDKAGGAGLGLFLLFEGLNTVCLNLDPGRCTEVIGAINIRGSMREAMRTPKSFNIFVRRR